MRHIQKPVGILLAILLLFGMVTAVPLTAGAAETGASVICGHSLTLNGDIGLNFFFNLTPEQVANGATVRFSWYNKTAEYTLRESDLTGNGYRATVRVAPAEMTYPIHAVLSYDDTECSDDYSVRDYAMTIINNPAPYMGTARLVEAMLHYGAKAQLKFNRNTSDLADNMLDYYVLSKVNLNEYFAHNSDMREGTDELDLSYEGTALVLNDTVSLKHYYKATDAPTARELKSAANFSGGSDGDVVWFEREDIAAAELDEPQVLYLGDRAYHYAPTDYIIKALTKYGDDESQKKNIDLLTALFWYNQAANYYFAPARVIDLSTLTEDLEAQNGDVLIGKLAGDYKITIADGAYVTLRDAIIDVEDTNQHAGITALGDATLTLKGENTVKTGSYRYPALYSAPEHTLTINGSGSLKAVGTTSAAAIGGNGNIVINGGEITASCPGYEYSSYTPAAIGAASGASCGSITITGGTVKATAGDYSAAIGSGNGNSVCGDITITGGTVSAIGGIAIGSGMSHIMNDYETSSCGNITITKDVTVVKATKTNSDRHIGAGDEGSTCGDIRIEEGANVLYLPKAHIDLSTLTADYMATDEDVLTGTLKGDYQITIADGANVTLWNVDITCLSESAKYAAITPLGDATITFAGQNTLRGGHEDYPALYAAENATLTIRGIGMLTAIGNKYSAGIGAAYCQSCGNIVIDSGIIKATGGSYAAAIGSAAGTHTDHYSCGDITISGGKVDAIGGDNGAAIGSGCDASCGDITITRDVECVRATAGENAKAAIGAGKRGSVGTVNIEAGARVIVLPDDIVDLSTLNSNYTALDGDVLTGVLPDGLTLSVSDGSMITLKDATVSSGGLLCYGSTMLTLEGSSSVKGAILAYGNLIINGSGALEARATEGKAGIMATGTLTINSGIVTAYGSDNSSGIGCSYDSKTITCGDITINGGTVTAIGGDGGAGIGSGCSTGMGNWGYPATNSCGSITINGGTVTATGGNGGAGIGTGRDGGMGYSFTGKAITGTNGSLTINGGTVTATGGYRAAAIGTGYLESSGIGSIYNNSYFYDIAHITVNGGNVTALAGEEAAAIGLGTGGHVGSITVTAGAEQVTAVVLSENVDHVGYVPPTGNQGNGYCEHITVEEGANIIYLPTMVDLSTLTADYEAQNYALLTGTLSGDHQITVADGAFVILRNANIALSADAATAGITPLGDAELLFQGDNTVRGGADQPGIYAAADSTLTIRGNGALNASSNGAGAGIGAGVDTPCGDIVIEGGTVTATGGANAAGIGGASQAACGDISVTGGTITATGGANAAGVGGGDHAVCGTISLTNANITATGGSNAAGAGSGNEGSCGTIRIWDNQKAHFTGGINAAGIGGGNQSVCGDINLDVVQLVSEVIVIGGANVDSAIGAGANGTCGTVTIDEDVRLTAYVPGDPLPLEILTGDYEAQDGDVLTGYMLNPYKITIADGATVTLRDVTITCLSDRHPWAGITPLGNATIILEGENCICGGSSSSAYYEYPAIYAAEGYTLTITGSGTLQSDGSSNNTGCAIGGGRRLDCGNIVIEGGNLIVGGSNSASAIGSGYQASCGTITIFGGTITATGGYNASAIGSGGEGSCGDIIITSDVTLVTATKGQNAPVAIGAGKNGSCGTVSIDDGAHVIQQ